MGLSAPWDNVIIPGGGAGAGPERAPIEPPSMIDGGGGHWMIVLAIVAGFMLGVLTGIIYTVTFT